MTGASCAVFGFGVHSWLRKHSWKPVCWRGESLVSSCRVSHTFKCIQCHSLPASSQDNMVHPEASSFTTRIEELKEGVRKTLCNDLDLRTAMILVDTLQHLGIGYHLEEETNIEETDVFHKFMDNNGNFKEPLGKDIMGLPSLHEASLLGAKDEEVTKQQLQKSKLVSKTSVARDIGLALEFSRQRRTERLEARSFIEKYRKECGRSSAILELCDGIRGAQRNINFKNFMNNFNSGNHKPKDLLSNTYIATDKY